MEKNAVLIIGSGHLAYRLQKLVVTRGLRVIHHPSTEIAHVSQSQSTIDGITRALQDVDLDALRMAYLVDDRDEYNVEYLMVLISLNKHLPITAALFNENVAPHLRATHPNIQVLNPAKIAAPAFVAALTTPVTHSLHYLSAKAPSASRTVRTDRLVPYLVSCFAALLLFATTYFHFAENLSWLDATYFVVVTIATVGYGDINLLNARALSKVIDIILILGSTVFIGTIVALVVDGIIKKRVQLALGRKAYPYANHVVVCGLGRLGYFIVEDLLKQGEQVVIIEKNGDTQSIEYFRRLGADVYIGDARLPQTLTDVNVVHAKALFSLINNDFANLEVGLNARSFEPSLRLILRIFDASMSKKIQENLDIHLTLSMTEIADNTFLETMGVR